ncbi:MAG TPA: hypothetical protein VNL18_01495 [Gemmatimonadales bacterium]|nr:hypothetical protein [Gemmatimonadales bacterium]
MKRMHWLVSLALVAAATTMIAGSVTAQTPTPAAKPPAMKHAAAGREKCMMCHAKGVMEAVPDAPASHGADWPVEACGWCHAPDAAMQSKTPPVMPHTAAGRDKCLMCHNVGVMEAVPDVPADHKARAETTCKLCHQPAAKE